MKVMSLDRLEEFYSYRPKSYNDIFYSCLFIFLSSLLTVDSGTEFYRAHGTVQNAPDILLISLA
jgi:hypothetical protein